jgi:hypothetical protein
MNERRNFDFTEGDETTTALFCNRQENYNPFIKKCQYFTLEINFHLHNSISLHYQAHSILNLGELSTFGFLNTVLKS